MSSINTLWFDAAIVLAIFAVGSILFGHFEEYKPKWRRHGVNGWTGEPKERYLELVANKRGARDAEHSA